MGFKDDSCLAQAGSRYQRQVVLRAATTTKRQAQPLLDFLIKQEGTFTESMILQHFTNVFDVKLMLCSKTSLIAQLARSN
ncbi:hypothetical protein RRG08_026166 [Elysia crispata]|uniref:Uncharacterized protein n=1 Tax=Elysia crispata TaxID=231223 RepID=A0AAE1DD92_9GAST|nr:hypothetical protein RRG08_026166 [Elysia crispata]